MSNTLKEGLVMSKSFTNWIKGQVRRNDSIGDIAREIRQDPCWPGRSRSKQTFLNHLLYEHEASPEALTALEKAYQEWEVSFGEDNGWDMESAVFGSSL